MILDNRVLNMDAMRVGKLYRDGFWSGEDEKGAEGFWDIAGDLAENLAYYSKDEQQEFIYSALKGAAGIE